MRSRSERGNRKMDEVQGWRSKRVNYEKEEGAVCRNQWGDGAQGKKQQPKQSLKSETLLGWERQEKNGNLSDNDKTASFRPQHLFDYGTSVTSSIRTTEHGPAIDRQEKSAMSKLQAVGLCREIRSNTWNSQPESKRRNHWELWVMPENQTSRRRRNKVKCQRCRSSECPEWTQQMRTIRSEHHRTRGKGQLY